MNKKTLTLLAFSVLLSAALPITSMAVNFNPGTQPPQIGSLTQIIGNALNTVWVIVATIAVVMIITAGIMFMTASGSAEKVGTARQTVIWAVVGLAIAILGFSVQTILNFIQGNV
jgi:uncharacterized membrane protein YcfT